MLLSIASNSVRFQNVNGIEPLNTLRTPRVLEAHIFGLRSNKVSPSSFEKNPLSVPLNSLKCTGTNVFRHPSSTTWAHIINEVANHGKEYLWFPDGNLHSNFHQLDENSREIANREALYKANLQ